jgi:tripartite-type tricarboxylate transporter receptor subunit TctC
MNFTRRRFLQLVGIAAAAPAFPQVASALSYPTRPVRLIVGFPPGGVNDIAARLIGQCLSERLGQQFIIENRAGASGNLATEAVVNASPDGYTLLLVGSSNIINPLLYEKLSFNFVRDIAPVAGVLRVPLVMDVNPAFPAKTVPEFIAYAKANPGKINMASGGNGTSQHLAGELFMMKTGINFVHVPYRGGAPALTDLLGGQVQMMFSNLPEAIEYIRAGKLRPLAVTTTARSETLPAVPALDDFVAGFEASGICGIGVPGNTPSEIVDRLNKEINAGLADPTLEARIADLGGVVLHGSPAEFGMLIAEETEKWGKVVKFAGIKAE